MYFDDYKSEQIGVDYRFNKNVTRISGNAIYLVNSRTRHVLL